MLFWVWFWIPACGKDGGTSWDDANLPALSTECGDCHDVNQMMLPVEGGRAGNREWMAEAGSGLVRRDPAIPEPGAHLALDWAERGFHDRDVLMDCGNCHSGPMSGGAHEALDCSGCHPVREDGLGHGVKTYTEKARELVFAGGESCAAGCHSWLLEEVTSAGFAGEGGTTPTYTGILDPETLLLQADNAHARLFFHGSRSGKETIKIAAFNPGCGGCHNAVEESHGTILSCTYCHRFGEPEAGLHVSHIRAIEDNRARLDPAAAGGLSCDYCHFPDETGTERSKAVCYNCHLSGHQPLNPAGKAHFWPRED